MVTLIFSDTKSWNPASFSLYEKTAQDLSGVVAREVTMLEHIERYKT